MIRKFVLIAAMVLVGQAQADVCSTKSLLLMGPSWHSKEEISGRDVHNDTYGFGVGCGADKDEYPIFAVDQSLDLTGFDHPRQR
jgi:hypothetical protein